MVSDKISKNSLLRLLALLRPGQTKYILGLTGRVVLSTTERLMIAYLAKLVIDAIMQGDLADFRSVLMGWVIFYLSYLAVAPFIIYLWRSAVYEGTANLREAVFRHMQRLPLGFLEQHHSGDALSILTNDVSAAEKAYQDDLLVLFEATLQGLTAAVFMLLLNWQLALLVILSSIAPLIINTLFAGPLRKVGQAVQDSLGGLSERMTDLLSGYQIIRTFNVGDWILERFENANDQVLNRSMRRVRMESALEAANGFGGFFGLLPLIIGAYFVMNGQTTFGIMVALIQLNNQIGYFVYSLGGTISRIQAALAATDRILNLLDTPAEPEQYTADESAAAITAGMQEFQPDGSIISFQSVDFGYTADQKILDGFSFTAQPGQMVAFAGPSGGGKSTIFKLLLGCYPPGPGSIRIQNRALQDYRLSELRDQLAYVPQDAYLFSGSIAENIRCAKPGASETEMIEASRAAYAHDFIMELPQGYETMVGERGARLSGGQRQRIAIARALLKDSPILLLDEATSALDSGSEEIVQKALEALMEGRTTLVIAHRFSTIRNANLIYVIDGGKAVEQGRHEELMLQKGIYANLFNLQHQVETAGDKTLE
jgi:ATP-binding cassette, subfamily B, bacterial